MARRVLIVEDEAHVRAGILEGLREAGFDAAVATGVRQAEAALAEPFDLVILDLGLPDGDGLDMCRDLRARGETVPIIAVTARGEPEARVLGLDSGVDDYLAKPFFLPELLSRIRSVLRRTTAGESPAVSFAGLHVDPATRRATREGEPLDLARREFDLLLFLLRHRGRAWTRAELLERVWGRDYDGDDRTVDVHVRRLRRKIERDARLPRLLTTVWGVGYRFAEEPDP